MLLHWIARLTGLAAIVPLMLIAFGEPGSAGYLIGWRSPLLGGCVSLACVVASLIVIGRTFDGAAYFFWALLSVPGLLSVLAGLRQRATPHKYSIA